MWMIRRCLKHKVATQIFRKCFIRLCLTLIRHNRGYFVTERRSGSFFSGRRMVRRSGTLYSFDITNTTPLRSNFGPLFAFRILKKNSAGHEQNYKLLFFLYMCKTWSVGKNIDWGCLRTCCGREYLDVRGIKWWEAGDICTLRCSIICTIHKILWHMWGSLGSIMSTLL
jgi:hypothetical protein